MDTRRRLVLVERLVWVLIFGGLATLVLGLAARDFDATTAWTLIVVGGVSAAAGVLLIWVRSRIEEAPVDPPDIAAATPARRRASHNEP